MDKIFGKVFIGQGINKDYGKEFKKIKSKSKQKCPFFKNGVQEGKTGSVWGAGTSGRR
jgi:hypothetical protein